MYITNSLGHTPNSNLQLQGKNPFLDSNYKLLLGEMGCSVTQASHHLNNTV